MANCRSPSPHVEDLFDSLSPRSHAKLCDLFCDAEAEAQLYTSHQTHTATTSSVTATSSTSIKHTTRNNSTITTKATQQASNFTNQIANYSTFSSFSDVSFSSDDLKQKRSKNFEEFSSRKGQKLSRSVDTECYRPDGLNSKEALLHLTQTANSLKGEEKGTCTNDPGKKSKQRQPLANVLLRDKCPGCAFASIRCADRVYGQLALTTALKYMASKGEGEQSNGRISISKFDTLKVFLDRFASYVREEARVIFDTDNDGLRLPACVKNGTYQELFRRYDNYHAIRANTTNVDVGNEVSASLPSHLCELEEKKNQQKDKRTKLNGVDKGKNLEDDTWANARKHSWF